MPDDEWPNDPTQRKVIISDFDLETPYGDRRQEIVFIGANMDERAICDQLDTALLSDEELVKYHERYAGAGSFSSGFVLSGSLLGAEKNWGGGGISLSTTLLREGTV